jgi:hypothetical protein
MRIAHLVAGPSETVQEERELVALIHRVVEAALTQIEVHSPRKPFITSRECAKLIGATPQHLSAMRARGEGPPWSGKGKWIRYERRAVHEWLMSLPRENAADSEKCSLPGQGHGRQYSKSKDTDASRFPDRPKARENCEGGKIRRHWEFRSDEHAFVAPKPEEIGTPANIGTPVKAVQS